jgi:peptidoglycan/LPS O-acetylase OafA/YrhL
MPDPTRGFLSVQAGRGIAAALVVMFHVSALVGKPKYWDSEFFGSFFPFGRYGVHFFFVLSGFIILWVHEKDIGRPERIGNYAYKRLVRIYPPYWITSLLVLAAMLAVPSFGELVPSTSEIVQSFALFGVEAKSILAVGWSLFYEMLFYVAFVTLLIHRSLGIAVLGVWFAACIVVPDFGYLTAPINLLFALGLGCAWYLRRHAVPLPGLLLGIGSVILVTVGYLGLTNYILMPLVGLAATAMLLGGVEMERAHGMKVPRLLVLLGDASYSIYLVHFVILSAAAKVLMVVGVPVLPAVLLLFVTGIVGGLVFHFAVEKPLLALFRKKRATNIPPAPRAEPS